MTPRVFMICGKIGAGKTTAAKLMAEQLPAFRISHDEMLVQAYGTELPVADFPLCCKRINCMAWESVEKLVSLGVSVVMEGWGSRELRDSARSETKRIGVRCEFVCVTSSCEERRRRVRNRNHDLKGEGYHISDVEFDRMNGLDEKIGEDEAFIFCANDTSGRGPDLAFLNEIEKPSQHPR